ncbi:uncharacterized protein LOC132061506 [Lycium ferocissimum]|uniref:uncharacterized protein LOC132061506 n=1 Tax=Lycium ferocissimum TaxID=112874 RepID=UPI002814E22D|nr:uncharacterized protein LOC132061506 [Lycium ferocissimum]
MSPYIFVIAMEYLQRELVLLLQQRDFKFHPRCNKLGVVHICFADDLLMFCNEEVTSIQMLQGAFHRFSAASGLEANKDKSSIYMSGVAPSLKQEILQVLWYKEGELPFKYLGVPLSSKKLTIAQCFPLVEKITERIGCWSAKLLSYAGRTHLIKSVIFGIQTYWAQIFVLPKRILKLIDSVCRTYLWTGSVSNSRKALVSWAKMCLQKLQGDITYLAYSTGTKLQY